MSDGDMLLDIPPHVDPARVADFDYMKPSGDEAIDVYEALARLHDGPDIAWTPHHGGHWIFTRGEDIKWAQESWQIFSNTEKGVPKGSCPYMPPITCDPPEHTRYRAVLNPYFSKGAVTQNYEAKSRAIMRDMIQDMRPRARCEFVSDFGFVAPLRIFWDFVSLPYQRRDDFLTWGRFMAGYGTPEQRVAAHQSIGDYLGELLDERLDVPGDDIFTGISEWRNNARYQRRDELIGMAELVFLGGQDTVASLMNFAMLRLVERPELQRRLKDEPELIPSAVEELLRRHGLSNTARLVLQDVQRKGANLKAGELIMTVNGLSGVDDRLYADPFIVDFDRGEVAYNSFGNGPHKCVGQHLARMELRLLLEEWSTGMPVVRLDPDQPSPQSHSGPVMGMNYLHLMWDC